MPNHHHQSFDHHEVVLDSSSSSSSSSSSVDCTLSLGTPSTRKTHEEHKRRPSSGGGNVCWDIFQTKQSHSPTTSTHNTNSGLLNRFSGGGDPLLTRRCANCDTTSTPLWRNGPRGPKSLCNACGIRYKKEERRATSTTTAAPAIIEPQNLMSQHHSWGGYHSQAQNVTSKPSEFRFPEEDDNNLPVLSWRLNVPDRPGLVHDYRC
ncbi:hypothetical protein GIB67_042780 [Kingdonia uniflora]|uniref:GATA-type domain-containing protein n=1 Tax=Kingdonia uniflora TaxID=39325 RepID=A0A7J7L0Z8_9MAGN|nr:hypothetical protein GIB67_042780 [Kingdonia uniflora]